MVDPCCGNNLQTGVKLIAIISLLWTLILIAVEIILLCSNGLAGVAVLNPELTNENLVDDDEAFINSTSTAIKTSTNNHTTYNHYYNHTNATFHDQNKALLQTNQRKMFSVPLIDIATSFVWIVSWVADIIFSIILYQAAKQKNATWCLIWFYFRCVVVIFRIIFLAIYIVAGLSIVTKIPVIALIIFRIYSIWVVNTFINQIRNEKLQVPSVVISFDDDDDVSKPVSSPSSHNTSNTINGNKKEDNEGIENPMFKN